MKITSMIASLSLLALAACGGGDAGAGAKSPTPNPRPSSTATISILQPAPGQVVEGTTLMVKVKIDGATVLEQASRDVRPDTGHVHLALDGETVTLLAGLEFELKDLKPGQHLLEASFAAADHGPFNPPVVTTTTFTVT
ncbi:MAG TPA: hypothetical protein VM841_09055 [Actinomycetota bacterium]|nr:hypothetical protein [Actinomycetota bacterium]